MACPKGKTFTDHFLYYLSLSISIRQLFLSRHHTRNRGKAVFVLYFVCHERSFFVLRWLALPSEIPIPVVEMHFFFENEPFYSQPQRVEPGHSYQGHEKRGDHLHPFPIVTHLTSMSVHNEAILNAPRLSLSY